MTTIIFDVETQRSAAEVGGWSNIEAMGLSVACTYDDDSGYRDWWEAQAADLIAELRKAELIIGFNVNKFDYTVLSLYGDVSGLEDKTFDILDLVHQFTNKRASLNRLAGINLGEAKSLESGVQAIRLYRQGRYEELVAYCRQDVELTRRLYEAWQNLGILWISEQDFIPWPGLPELMDMAEEGEERDERRATSD